MSLSSSIRNYLMMRPALLWRLILPCALFGRLHTAEPSVENASQLAFSADGGDGTELQFDIAGKTFRVTRSSTGSWYRYQTLPIGRFYLGRAERFTLRAGCSALKGGAVMNLKAV